LRPRDTAQPGFLTAAHSFRRRHRELPRILLHGIQRAKYFVRRQIRIGDDVRRFGESLARMLDLHRRRRDARPGSDTRYGLPGHDATFLILSGYFGTNR
jgi:hypothetical protein